MTAVSEAQINDFDPPERDSLVATERSLAAMKERLDAILDAPALTEETLVEITAILNNVSYVFLYLEANDDQVSYGRLLPFRDAFYRNDALDARILGKLHELSCSESGTEQARLAYIRQLEDKRHRPDPEDGVGMAALRAEAKAAETRLAAAQTAFLERLGAKVIGRPSVAFYRLAGRTENPALRAKFALAWYKVADEEAATRASIVDRMIALRHRSAGRHRLASPMAGTLEKCRLPEARIAEFLASYLDSALAAQSKLEAALVSAFGDAEAPFSHFGRYMRAHFQHKSVPLFDLDRCLDYAFGMARAVFGLEFRAELAPGGAVFVADVSRNGLPAGRINFDLWLQNCQNRGANHTLGLRNRAEWRRIVQRPEAYVSCRFAQGPDGGRKITFQNVHSLLHEFGHAINHLLMQEQMPNRSGLEYLPLERLEFLSMWSEKWVYHPAFAKALGLDAAAQQELALCQDAKKIEYVSTFAERALIASLDFACHRTPGLSLREAYDRLDRDHGIGRFVRFSEIPQYFAWPMFVANPGANFSYLFGATWSVEAFLPFMAADPAQCIPPGTEARFAPCFRVEMPSPCLDPARLPEFYLTGLRVPETPARGRAARDLSLAGSAP